MNAAQPGFIIPEVAPQSDKDHYFGDHYLHVLERARWYIIISGPVALILSLTLILLVDQSTSTRGWVLAMCVLCALLSSLGAVFVYDFFNKSIRSKLTLSRFTGRAALEAIPIFSPANRGHGDNGLVAHPLINVPCIPMFTPKSFGSLLSKMQLRLSESTDQSIIVSSHESGCGKSTISANLAMAFANLGHPTLLVDGDLRRGTLKSIFGLHNSGGLSDLLSASEPLTDEDCMRFIEDTEIPDLFVLPSGAEHPNPRALFSSPRMEEFKRFCGKRVALMVMDTPPLGEVSDAEMMMKYFSHYLLVVRCGKTKMADVVNLINDGSGLLEKTIGYVLNGATQEAAVSYRRNSGHAGLRTHTVKTWQWVLGPASIAVTTALLAGVGVTDVKNIPHATARSGQTRITASGAQSTPGRSLPAIAKPTADETEPAWVVAPAAPPVDTNDSSPGASRVSTYRPPATNALPARGARPIRDGAPSTLPGHVQMHAETANLPADADDQALAALGEIRAGFARRDTSGLRRLFDQAPIDDGEYYLLKARHLCETGEWRAAQPLIEKAMTTPARALSGDRLTQSGFYCRAKCLDAAFDEEPTPARGAAAMEAWYDAKYQLRGAPQDSRYLYADGALRRISMQINGR